MAQILGLLLLSFFITAVLLVPLIDFLYKLRLKSTDENKRVDTMNKLTPITAKLLAHKNKRPIGAGALVVAVTAVLSLWSYGLLGIQASVAELFILLFTMLSFALLGLYDDVRKNFNKEKTGFFGLRWRHKLLIQCLLGLFIGAFFWFILRYDFVNIHWFGMLDVGILFIPLTAFVVVAFANAYNITDGLDGLSTGTLLICLIAFVVLSSQLLHPSLALFIAIWIGSILAFLYFNIYPARVELGDTGALAFGATLAVVGLLTGKILALAVIGGVFILEAGSSLVQMLSKHYTGKKFFAVAPLHLWFRNRGWEEPKVVMRAWLVAALFAIFGLWLGVIK
ncbi:MAG: phospho-N-acetylmuramoyl-pentapeptide-transferase [Patescibacteria group bacterium]|nr:phospho-N-acetylmuramoyl-pentapeptide-transferase [Patescibacteria group bacterium]MCL5431734.1 phospho-N-acetylmuramoyl-pentapeptide-transferase [Patescibacteria group bacterium]